MPRMLILSRRFAPLFWCQFFAAFNDNFLKTALVFLIIFQSGSSNSEALVTLASAVFIAPYFFLSGLAGEIADRYDKAKVAQHLKFAEIFIAAAAAWGYFHASLPILFLALFGFGVLAALFGPIKYGILPDHLRREELPGGNAFIEGATFIAILLGTIAGGLASRGARESLFIALILGIAAACWVSALLIPSTGQAVAKLKISVNILVSTATIIRWLRADPRLWWGAMVTSWFWLVGIVVVSLLPPMIKTLVGGNEQAVTLYLALFSISVGAGSALAAALARGRIFLIPTVVGAVMIGLFAIDAGLALLGAPPSPSLRGPAEVFASAIGVRAAVDLCGLAVSGGLFIVPAFAAVQAWSSSTHRARTIAAINVINAAFMTGGTLLMAIMQKLGATVPALFILVGALTLVVAMIIWKTMPKGDAVTPQSMS